MLTERQGNPRQLPYALMTLYYGNVYFGLRQALVLDSFRAAIDQVGEESDPQAKFRRDLYLAALVYAASVSTSASA